MIEVVVVSMDCLGRWGQHRRRLRRWRFVRAGHSARLGRAQYCEGVFFSTCQKTRYLGR